MQNMKYSFLSSLAALALVAGLMSSCKADVDLKNIDKRTWVNVGLALPIGDITATLGDFLGDNQVDNIFINDKGIIYFRDTFDISRTYHEVDLAKYISEAHQDFKVYEKLEGLPFFEDGKITGMGIEIPLSFPLTIKLNGINTDVDNERLDSAQIKNASFVSNIHTTDLPLPWEWITRVEIELGEAFSRPEGNTVRVYTKGDGYGYNQDIDIPIEDFTICLMKNRNLNPATDQNKYNYNTIDSCNFTVHFYFEVPMGVEVTVPTTAAFNYDLAVQFIKYYAIWGYFKPSSEMRDADTVVIANEWPKWKDLQRARLPFAEPTVDMMVTTQVAGRTVMHGEYLYAETTADGQKEYATFNGSHKRDYPFTEGQWLPLTSEIGDSATAHIPFDNTETNGRIDRLFAVRPDILGYKFSIEFDRMVTPQIRITENTDMRIDADITLPFIFNEGIGLNYFDTVNDVNLTDYTIDSLLADANILDTVVASDIRVYLHAHNRIPLNIKGVVRFADSLGNIIMDPVDPTVPMRLSNTDTLRFLPPKYVREGGTYHISEPGESVFILVVDKPHFDLFNQIKSIRFNAFADDDPLHSAYRDIPGFQVKLDSLDALTIQIGVAANIDAVINPDGNTKK